MSPFYGVCVLFILSLFSPSAALSSFSVVVLQQKKLLKYATKGRPIRSRRHSEGGPIGGRQVFPMYYWVSCGKKTKEKLLAEANATGREEKQKLP